MTNTCGRTGTLDLLSRYLADSGQVLNDRNICSPLRFNLKNRIRSSGWFYSSSINFCVDLVSICFSFLESASIVQVSEPRSSLPANIWSGFEMMWFGKPASAPRTAAQTMARVPWPKTFTEKLQAQIWTVCCIFKLNSEISNSIKYGQFNSISFPLFFLWRNVIQIIKDQKKDFTILFVYIYMSKLCYRSTRKTTFIQISLG